MVETEQYTPGAATPESFTPGEATTITTIVEALESEVETLDIHEGDITGHLYVKDGSGYQSGVLTKTGIRVTHVDTPEEPLTPLAKVRPDPGETVSDAVDSLTYAGD